MRWFEREMAKNDVCGKEMSRRNGLVVKTRGACVVLLVSFRRRYWRVHTYNSSRITSASVCGVSFIIKYQHISLCFKYSWRHYSVPLGIHFPDSAQPSCGTCEKDLLGVFGGSLGSSASSKPNTDSLLNLDDTSSIIGLKSTYADVVQTVQRTCGQNLCRWLRRQVVVLMMPLGGLVLGVLWGLSQMRGLGGGMGWRFGWVCMHGLGADLVQELYRLVNPCICRAQVISALELGLWLSTLLLRFIDPHSQTYDGVLFLEISLVS